MARPLSRIRRRTRRALGALAAVALGAGVVAAVPTAATATPSAPAAAPAAHTVSFDQYSMLLDGTRTFVWSGEFHPFRLPSPDLWRDVLQKMKAEGYNAVSFYFDWAYHSPANGVYDFSGVRDLDRLLTIADQTGLYVIARPGPYINAETNGGGLPGWTTTLAGHARTNDADFVAAGDQWLSAVDAIVAKHQYTNGTGSVILYQIENELAATGTSQQAYMQHLYDKVRADGVSVPIFHNDKGRNGIWVPQGANVPGTVVGPTDLYAFDGYPGGVCSTDATTGSPSTAPDWGIWGAGGATGGSTASPNTPGFAAEFGGGWFDYWGSKGTYDCTAQREGPGYEKVFYGTNIANRLTVQNFYMTFGGTSWGWLPAPVVYSSYDYGAAISESRQLRAKATTMKQLGLFLQSVTPITHVDKGAVVTPSNPAIKVYHDVDNDSGTHFYIAMHNPSNATTNDAFTFPLSTSDGTYTVPQQGSLAINGQDAKILTADYDMSGSHLVYSTSQIMTHLVQNGHGLALLHGPNGEPGETVLRYGSAPTVKVLSGAVDYTYDSRTRDLRLDYVHDGLATVRISGGGHPAMTLLLADDATAGTFWRQDTAAGPVLERGPELVRTATVSGSTLQLTGDTSGPSALQVWAPSGVTGVTWNGAAVTARAGSDGSLRATAGLPGPVAVTLPDLSTATWRTAAGSPESSPSFDDSAWATADRSTTNSTTKPPAGQPVLTADDYGFHQGDVWYRGHYSGAGAATSVTLRYGGGGAGMAQAWLDGVYLGQHVIPSAVSSPPTTGTVTFAVPAGLQGDGSHVLSVMVRNDGHNEDGGVNDAQKEGRGLISATMTAADGSAVVPAATTWKIQGDLGGESLADPVRGIMNVGGSYGERRGWYLPGFADQSWQHASVPATGNVAPGTSWYRTTFNLAVPAVDDASLGLTIGNPATPQSTGNYRALLYVNGWNIGQYIANVGPQHTFVVPNGILRTDGANTLAVQVTSAGGAGNGLEKIALTNLGTVRGGVPVAAVDSPGWTREVYGAATDPAAASMVPLSSPDAPASPEPGDTFQVTTVLSDTNGPALQSVRAALHVPAGWSATLTQALPTKIAIGASYRVTWRVTVGADAAAGAYALDATAGFTQGGVAGSTGATYPVVIVPVGLTYVSDLPFVSSTNGYGPVERDTNVGGSGAGDGATLSMRGVTYAKGLGTNAASTVVVDLGGRCTSFATDVGLDDSAGSSGSVTFTVSGDATTLASTGVIRGGAAVQHLTADVTGVQQLTLTVGDGGDGNAHDNADWGGAQLICGT